MLTCDAYLSPPTLDAAFDAIEAAAGAYRLVAGATDLLPWAREGRAGDVHVPTLIDIAAIPELKARSLRGDRVTIGAATPFQRFIDDPMLRRSMPGMDLGAVWFADDQIRESATIGGNIVNASPAGDGIPPLLALNAAVDLASRRDGAVATRRLALSDFLLGPGRTDLHPAEILVRVECDAVPGYGGAFEKVGHRRSLVISVACGSAMVKLDGTGRRFEDVRLAIGGVGPAAIRFTAGERRLVGETLSAGLVEEVGRMAIDHVQSRSRQAYRRGVLKGFVVRAVLNAARAAGGDLGSLVPDLELDYA